MSGTFKAGDIVQLKSGSPKMTVTQTGNDGFGTPSVWCVWFDEKKQVTGIFPVEAVKAVSADAD